MKNSVGGEIVGEMDEFQERYLAHQVHPGGKKDELIALIKERHSNRRFSDDDITNETDAVLDAMRHAPSSCDRFGVRVKVITDRHDKETLSGLLVGGVGWAHRVPVLLLLLANPEAYKGGDGGDEVIYNPYVDAGVLAQTAMLAATSLGLHTAFINPQIRKPNREFFYTRFKPKDWDSAIFTGAVALGKPHEEPIEKTRRLIETIEEK